jgi:hypothetical protein
MSFAALGAIYYGIKMFSLAGGNMTTALGRRRKRGFFAYHRRNAHQHRTGPGYCL